MIFYRKLLICRTIVIISWSDLFLKALVKRMPFLISLLVYPLCITGCWVFKAGIQNWKGFCIKINCSQIKLLNFENWTNGEPQQLAKIRVFKVDYFDFSRKKIEWLGWIRCEGNYLQLLGFWNFFVFFRFFPLKLVYF